MPPTNIINGRVSTQAARHRRSDSENAEIQMYLSKLKDLVPFMPKNRKLSKLEVIQHVIDYICDLQMALETHPAGQNTTPFEDYLNNNSSDPKASATVDSMMDAVAAALTTRQPLGVRPTSPNQIVEPTSHTNSHHHSNNSHHQQQSGTDLMFLQQIMSSSNNVSIKVQSSDVIRSGMRSEGMYTRQRL